MKKIIAILLILGLCIGLCACGKEKSLQIEYPEGWDRIAEATATLNQYYACTTEEEFRAVMHSSVSDNDLKMVMDLWLGFRETWDMDNMGISEQYVRKIKYIETYKGCDVFLVADGYVTKDGTKTPDDPTPALIYSDLIFQATAAWARGQILALTVENGRYVIPNSQGENWQKYFETFSICSCDLGVVVIPGDPCKGCNGTGRLTEQPSAETENEDNGTCITCDGTGWVDNENYTEGASGSSLSSVVLNRIPCPDCSDLSMGSPVGSPNLIFPTPCSDCEGTGLENYTFGDCPDCSGKGYSKIG